MEMRSKLLRNVGLQLQDCMVSLLRILQYESYHNNLKRQRVIKDNEKKELKNMFGPNRDVKSEDL